MDSIRFQFLREAVEDSERCAALQEFFDIQARWYTDKTKEEMLALDPNIEAAKRNAVSARTYETAMEELKHFVRTNS